MENLLKFQDPENWAKRVPRESFSRFRRVSKPGEWFSVYDAGDGIYAFYEDGQIEEALSFLLLGESRALLIDSGNGIGNIRLACRALTGLPISLVNTHSHYDHIGGNYLFDDLSAFDDPAGIVRRTAAQGYSAARMRPSLEGIAIARPLPEDFDPEAYSAPPYRVSRWIADGDAFDLGGRRVEVVHTPGHSPDSICLLDERTRRLFVGDIFYTGSIYTWLEGGDLDQMIASYRRMIDLFPRYDLIMPSHNEIALEKEILRDALRAAEDVREGRGTPVCLDNGHRVYHFGRFAFDTVSEKRRIGNFSEVMRARENGTVSAP